ncbi:MAG: tRNA (guanosine(37)-N1)-methyltransferase TrmD [Candidatus Omnitrophica bacterium]|nr:tRNA (guanosine(37)-N1)-methyltransferase TrmD [Candidatus Omnitrophota bacterium]
MRIDILTLFPKMFDSVLGESIIKRARAKGKIAVHLHDLRDWTFDSHRTADDKPFGGGAGMVMKVEPIYLALKQLVGQLPGLPISRLSGQTRKAKIILLTPQGRKLEQGLVKELAKEKRLILICGHYEGVDERVRGLVDEEISIGDYILTCGEIPALVIVDSVARLLPGVLGHSQSAEFESFENNLLEYPQYTRPAEFKGMTVPDVLMSGDHKRIAEWRSKEAIKRTKELRPDLLKRKM